MHLLEGLGAGKIGVMVMGKGWGWPCLGRNGRGNLKNSFFAGEDLGVSLLPRLWHLPSQPHLGRPSWDLGRELCPRD